MALLFMFLDEGTRVALIQLFSDNDDNLHEEARSLVTPCFLNKELDKLERQVDENGNALDVRIVQPLAHFVGLAGGER